MQIIDFIDLDAVTAIFNTNPQMQNLFLAITDLEGTNANVVKPMCYDNFMLPIMQIGGFRALITNSPLKEVTIYGNPDAKFIGTFPGRF